MIPSAVFILAIVLQTKISLSSKFFGKSWEYAKNFSTCFVDLEKAFDRVPREKFWGVLREYGIDGRLLLAVKSLYSCSEVCVRVGKSPPFTVGVGLRQGCVLSLLFSSYSTSAVAKLRPSGRIRPADQFNPTRQIPCKFLFKCHVSDCGQQCNSINCCLSRKSYCIRPSSVQAVANSALGPKRLAAPSGA